MLPNFIGVGSYRCGTTWIFECLKTHPQVSMPLDKEVMYFNRNFSKGSKWYENFFKSSDGAVAVGEFSPGYFNNVDTAPRIKETVPDAKLIVCLRNPADQVFSHYHLMKRRKRTDNDFWGALDDLPHLVRTAHYHMHLTRYLEFFDKEQILVLIYEDIKKDSESFLRKIYSFLDIDVDHKAPARQRQVNAFRNVRSRWLEGIVAKTGFVLRKIQLYPLVAWIRNSGFVSKIRQANEGQVIRPVLPPEDRKRLDEMFAEDKVQIGKYLGRKLDCWM